MNTVRQRERQRAARHEATHAAVAVFLGRIPDDVEIIPAPRTGGYTTGSCASFADPKIDAAMTAAGCLDGLGSGADEADLEQLVPDPAERERVLEVTERLMAHPEFVALRNAVWRALTFKDRLSRREIERIAAATTPDARLPSGGAAPLDRRDLRPASGRSMSGKGLRTRRVGGLRPPNGGPLILEVAYHK
jgi:hypothetical protein